MSDLWDLKYLKLFMLCKLGPHPSHVCTISNLSDNFTRMLPECYQYVSFVMEQFLWQHCQYLSYITLLPDVTQDSTITTFNLRITNMFPFQSPALSLFLPQSTINILLNILILILILMPSYPLQ